MDGILTRMKLSGVPIKEGTLFHMRNHKANLSSFLPRASIYLSYFLSFSFYFCVRLFFVTTRPLNFYGDPYNGERWMMHSGRWRTALGAALEIFFAPPPHNIVPL